MTGPHLCELEQWPDSERKPSVYVLCLLAGVYETDVLCLLDLADHESLPQQDRLVLMRRLRAETPFGERVLALAEARGLSLRELARRVPCDASHLSKVVHGRKRPSLRVAARLDDLLEAAGELVALAEAAGAAPTTRPSRAGPRPAAGERAGRDRRGHDADAAVRSGPPGDRGVRPAAAPAHAEPAGGISRSSGAAPGQASEAAGRERRRPQARPGSEAG